MTQSASTHPSTSFLILSLPSVHSGNIDRLSVYCLYFRLFAHAVPLFEIPSVPLLYLLIPNLTSSIFQHMCFSSPEEPFKNFSVNTQRSSSHHVFMTQLCNWVFNVCIYLCENRNHFFFWFCSMSLLLNRAFYSELPLNKWWLDEWISK